MSPLAGVYTKERAVPVCLETLTRIGFDLAADSRIKLDLDDRPQKSPRACVIAADPPAVVHLITRAQGGIHDYQAFLHEAGHALHYAGCDPALPYTFRLLSRDHALTEIYSFLVESITPRAGLARGALRPRRRPTARDNAEATRFLEAILFRRYAAKLGYELELWSDFEHAPDYADTYAARPARRDRRPLPRRRLRRRPGRRASTRPTTCAPGSARRSCAPTCARRSASDWWERRETGDFLRPLFLQGTRPSSEDVAAQIGFDPLDTAPLLVGARRRG